MGKTTIEWTRGDDGSLGRTWNAVRGCSRLSEGCRHCYAERQALRFSRPGEPFHQFVTKVNGHASWTGKVELIEKHLEDPLHWRKPCRVFANSMSDLWHEKLPLEDKARIYAVMRLAYWHTYQVLTKRPEIRLAAFKSPRWWAAVGKAQSDLVDKFGLHKDPKQLPVPTPWIWEGVSAEDQNTWDERTAVLEQTPAAIRFVSLEPQLEYVDVGPVLARGKIHWLVQGGESGPDARPFNVEWARRTIEQCRAAGTAVFCKQLGANVISRNDAGFDGDTPTSWPMDTRYEDLDEGYQGAPVRIHLKDRKGGDMSEWPSDVRVRQYPEVRK